MRKLDVLGNERGFIKLVFITAILVFLIYSGIQFGMPYYRYSAFKADAKELARISLGNVDRTRTQIFERAQELNIPIGEQDITVTRTEKTVRIQTSWSETVDLLGVYQKTLDFDLRIEE
jgi:hypothetical protein